MACIKNILERQSRDKKFVKGWTDSRKRSNLKSVFRETKMVKGLSWGWFASVKFGLFQVVGTSMSFWYDWFYFNLSLYVKEILNLLILFNSIFEIVWIRINGSFMNEFMNIFLVNFHAKNTFFNKRINLIQIRSFSTYRCICNFNMSGSIYANGTKGLFNNFRVNYTILFSSFDELLRLLLDPKIYTFIISWHPLQSFDHSVFHQENLKNKR